MGCNKYHSVILDWNSLCFNIQNGWIILIETSTLFILGAGASAPYGYPLGSELRDNINKDI